MYNEELKNEYIEHNLLEKYAILRAQKIFENIAPVEAALGKDVAEMSPDEIELVKKCFDTKSFLGMDAKCRDLRKYLIWALEQGKSSRKTLALAFSNRQYDNTAACEVSMFSSPEEVEDFLSTTFYAPEEENQDLIHRINIWFMYSGVYPSETFWVKKNQVSSSNMTITIGEKVLSIPDQAKRAMMIYENIDGYVIQMENGPSRFAKKRDSEYYLIPKIKASPDSSWKSINHVLLRKGKEYVKATGLEKKIVSTDVYLSGWFWRTYQEEIKTGIIDLDAARGVEPSNSKMGKQYMEDYITWKRTFYPLQP